MEENNKKVLVPTIIAVVTLVLLTVGATYAYFRVATDNNFGTPKIEASTPSIGSVALSTGSNLTMNLTAEQMMQKDSNVTYYASPYGTTTEEYTENIGTATVTGDGAYTCTYTLTIDDNSNSLYDKFQSGYANKSAGQVILTVKGVEYDFNTAGLFPKEISGTMSGLTSSAPQYITAQLKLINSKTIDQSNLSGQNITLTFGVEDFSCTAEEEQDDSLALCIRATELHQITCDESAGSNIYDNYACQDDIGEGNTHVFGNLGSQGAELQVGDALTCDVNGDGAYDEEIERFYYVSDYYNTTTKQFESDKATLIYYKNTGDAEYDASGENWHGPVTAITKLPTTSEWINVRLINPQRAIINREGKNTVQVVINYDEDKDYNNANLVPEIETYNLPTAFDYSGYSARLATHQEMDYANSNCGNVSACSAFGENTNYFNYNFNWEYWIETPNGDQNLYWDEFSEEWFGDTGLEVYRQSVEGNMSGYLFSSYAYENLGIRPVIEVYKTDIDN